MGLKVSVEKRDVDNFFSYISSRSGVQTILRVTRLMLNVKKDLYGEHSSSVQALYNFAGEGSSFMAFCGMGNTTYQCGLQYKKLFEQIDLGQTTLVNFLDTVQKTCGLSSSLGRALLYIDKKEIYSISDHLKTQLPTLFKRNMAISYLFSFYTLGKNSLALGHQISLVQSTDPSRWRTKKRRAAAAKELAEAKKQVLLMTIRVTTNVVSVIFAGIFFTQTGAPVLFVHALTLFSSLLSITSNIADNLIKVDS